MLGYNKRKKVHCNFEKAVLRELPLYLAALCGFQAPTFRLLRLGPVDQKVQRFEIAERQ